MNRRGFLAAMFGASVAPRQLMDTDSLECLGGYTDDETIRIVKFIHHYTMRSADAMGLYFNAVFYYGTDAGSFDEFCQQNGITVKYD